MTSTPSRRHRRQTTVLLTLLITCVVALGAMGAAWALGWNLAEPSNVTPSPTPQTAQNAAFPTAAALAEAIKAAGTICTGFRPPQVRTNGRDNGSCGTEGGGELVLTVFAEPNAKLHEADAVRNWGNPSVPFSMLVGWNWTIVGPDGVIEALAKKLAGEIVLTPR